MKKLSMIFLFTGLAGNVLYAQGTGSIFDQQSTKFKLMLAQIAAYQVMLSGLQTGYRITETGLNTAHDLKSGSFNLNQAYLNSLKQVSPVIQSNPKGKAMIAMQANIQNLFSRELTWQQQQKIMNAAELTYIVQVQQNLLRQCNQDMNDLSQVLTPGQLQLNDHQRLERIDHLYARMQDKQAFAISFTSRCRQMAQSRKRSTNDRNQLKKLYGIHS
ncbi:hypothetical protein HH214_09540 [Mucilaginibacter robiniae]|uniref:TerB family tellurite resistance protein n=1 Tax=Mucilaginibacter robiniae TaxID=2728022 RepID=A0A7L5E1C4_9SPHI|nr:hypothetical protein [Mucilaginibacter robiniae]QJD96099.1 hypothetical protein HH214_09540 [Mucilaginibacter robiniae]